MTRTAFLAALEQLLAPLPEAERKDALSYYEDYLDAAGPENEARAIAELGSPEEVARKILDEQTPAGSSATPASPARKPHSRWRMVLGTPKLPRCSRWSPFLLPQKFLLPLRKCLPKVPLRSPPFPFPLQTA